MKSLRSEQLGDQVLEFTERDTHNRLKTRHKRYLTIEIREHSLTGLKDPKDEERGETEEGVVGDVPSSVSLPTVRPNNDSSLTLLPTVASKIAPSNEAVKTNNLLKGGGMIEARESLEAITMPFTFSQKCSMGHSELTECSTAGTNPIDNSQQHGTALHGTNSL
jgi:hypothetical protein